MGFFSSEAFLESAAAAFHPNERPRIGVVHAVGRGVRTVIFEHGRALVDCPFLDYFEPVPARGSGDRVPHVPRVAIETVPLQDWRPTDDAPHVAPLVDWSRFPTFDAFVEHARARFGGAFQIVERKRRKLAREVGAVELVDDDRAPEVLALAFAWKGEQYVRTGLVDQFSSERTRGLFTSLHARRALKITTLRAGGRVAALHVGAVHEGRFLYWVPAHDPALAHFSPGTILLEDLLRSSHAAGHAWFDFLLGDESYKMTFATHAVRVGSLGRPPLARRAWAPLREQLMRPLRTLPGVHDALRRARRAVAQRSLR